MTKSEFIKEAPVYIAGHSLYVNNKLIIELSTITWYYKVYHIDSNGNFILFDIVNNTIYRLDLLTGEVLFICNLPKSIDFRQIRSNQTSIFIIGSPDIYIIDINDYFGPLKHVISYDFVDIDKLVNPNSPLSRTKLSDEVCINGIRTSVNFDGNSTIIYDAESIFINSHLVGIYRFDLNNLLISKDRVKANHTKYCAPINGDFCVFDGKGYDIGILSTEIRYVVPTYPHPVTAYLKEDPIFTI